MSNHKRIKNIESLHIDFREIYKELLTMCAFMQPWETYRTFERQNYLHSKGPHVTRARGGESPHNYRVAADSVFNPDFVVLPTVRAKGKDWPALWDKSSEATRGLWMHYGQTAERLGLEWGGRWGDLDEHGLGFDLPHVQMKDWKRYIINT